MRGGYNLMVMMKVNKRKDESAVGEDNLYGLVSFYFLVWLAGSLGTCGLDNWNKLGGGNLFLDTSLSRCAVSRSLARSLALLFLCGCELHHNCTAQWRRKTEEAVVCVHVDGIGTLGTETSPDPCLTVSQWLVGWWPQERKERKGSARVG